MSTVALSKCCDVRMYFDESFFCRKCKKDKGWYYVCEDCKQEVAACACVKITRPPVEQRTSEVR